MAQAFHNLEKTAELLGLSAADVNQLRERNELRGYRDGSDWKFKAEDIEAFAQKLKAEKESPSADGPSDSDGDVLLSELELGQSDPGASGTVIGAGDKDVSPVDSDVKLAESDIKLGGSEIDPAGVGQEAGALDSGSGLSDFEELDLTLDDDLTLEDSQISLSAEAVAAEGSDATADSALDLSGKGEGLDDDDLVLGGSGSGSDITIGQDSGISLVDPRDSGLSLEEPLELVGGGEDSLELGEDDMLTFSEGADTESPTELKTDDGFMLTPLEDDGEEDSESGSQVIALDTAAEGDEAATMVASDPGGAMAAMLDDETGDTLGMGAPVVAGGAGQAPQGFADGAALGAATAALPEAPYTVWNILSLTLCAIFLILTGMMAYDLLRNMWSWDTPYDINSSIMDEILSWFEK